MQENFSLPNLRGFSNGVWLDGGKESRAYDRQASALDIRAGDRDQKVATLSGGNQQKVVLAKWLENGSEIILFDEPTRGIDVGAKYEIYLLINRLAEAGKAILLVSSELPEILGMCDRVLVMGRGEIRGELAGPSELTQEAILSLAI